MSALRSPGTWLEHWLLTEERGTDVPAFIRAIQANARNAALEEASAACEPMTQTEPPYCSSVEECQRAILALKTPEPT